MTKHTPATPLPYVVTLRFQFPSWDERDGIPFDVTATSKADAVKAARRAAYNGGHLCGGQGRVTFRALLRELGEDT
jgi:hypothetical protein